MLTWEAHCSRWKACQLCPLAKVRKRVVLARGRLPSKDDLYPRIKIPCDILFIGEGPGKSENTQGQPFIGPAGHLLEKIVRRAIESSAVEAPEMVSYNMTNLVACIPPIDVDRGKEGEPPTDAIEACQPRLEEFVRLVRPKLIVCVGALAEAWIMAPPRYLLKWYEGKLVTIRHPSSILQANIAQQGLLTQRAIVTLTNAVDSLFSDPSATS